VDYASQSATSATLLAQLRHVPPDQTAWDKFTQRYGPRIYAWCRQWNLQDADAQDVTQSVLLKLVEKMQSFDYDASRSFRGWLRTVARHAFSDFWEGRGRVVATGGSQSAELIGSVQAREDLMKRLEEEFDYEILDEAMSRVRQRVTPSTWRAFEMTALEGSPGAEVAKVLGMNVATVYVARSKVQKFLQEERCKLEGQG
jgi:RNA polymerase sigma-70 factor (ECF subfamily)